jgi:hypothetical protein
MTRVGPAGRAYGSAAAVVLAFGLSLAIVRFATLVALLVPLAAGFMAVTLTVRRLGRHFDEATARRIMWWSVVSLLLHLLAGLIITNSSLSLYLGGDAFTYHRGAIAILRHWNDGFPMPRNLQQGKEGFYYVLAALYWMFGVSTSAGLVFNATLSAILVPLLVDSARRLFGPSATRSIPPMALLLPGLFIWSTQLLKEACVLFLAALAVNCALRVAQRITPGALFVLTTSLAALMTFRAQVGFVLAAGMLLGLTLGRGRILGGVGTGVGALAVVAVLVGSVGLGYAGFQVAIDSNLKQADTVRLDLATSARSGFAEDVHIATPGQAVRFLPRGLTALLLGPFPWQLGTVRQLPAIVDVLAWWSLIPFLWRGLRRGWRLVGRRLLVVMIPATAASMVLALATGNFGTIVRERTQIVVILLPLIAYGVSLRRPRIETVDPELEVLEPVAAGA